MHLADTLARGRRYATCLVAGDDEQPRLFGLARGSVAALRIFGSACDRFAPRLFARGFDTALLFGGTGRLLATSFFAGSLEPALRLGLAGSCLLGSFLGGHFSRQLSRLTGRLAASFLARRFDAALVLRGACGGFAARFLTRSLAGGFANGVEPASLLGIVPAKFIAATFALAQIAAPPIGALTVVLSCTPRPAVAVAPLWVAVECTLPRMLFTVAAVTLTVRAAFVFCAMPGGTVVRRRRFLWCWHGCAHWTPVGWIVAAALFDHPVEPLIDRHVDALRRVALGLSRPRAEASQIPRTARLHPRVQTTFEGAVCAQLSGRRW